MSLNFRITISAAVVLIVFICLTALALERAFFESTESALRDTMNSQLYALMAATEVEERQVVMSSNELDTLLGLPGSGVYASISNQSNEVLWQSSSLLGINLPKPISLSLGEKLFKKVSVEKSEYYITAYGVSWPTAKGNLVLTFSITTDLSSFDKQINRFRMTLWGWLVAMATLLLLSQAAILRWGLAPLRKVGVELSRIEAGKQQQIESQYPMEVEQLTDNINLLLEHERQQKIRYRDAMGNLAHSLKTPMAILQTSLQTNLHEQDKQAMQVQINRMNSIVEYQLQRAVTAGTSGIGESVALLSTIERLLNSLQKVYSDKAINVTSHVGSSLIFRGDEGDLMEVLGNLLDNAFKWANQNIEISAQQNGKQLTIYIDDDGPGLAPEEVENILLRGVRADQTIAGHGIGLSIVKDIAQTYGGNLTILNSDLGGAKVCVSL